WERERDFALWAFFEPFLFRQRIFAARARALLERHPSRSHDRQAKRRACVVEEPDEVRFVIHFTPTILRAVDLTVREGRSVRSKPAISGDLSLLFVVCKVDIQPE